MSVSDTPPKILVVDDEPDLELLIRQKFRRKIRAQEVTFLFAGDGQEALDVLAEHADIDIVLTDINMPRMDGLTLLGRVRAQDRLVKVVIVSAYGDMENIRTAMNRGAFDFIMKPINFDDLEVTIEKTREELQALKQGFVLQQQLTSIQRELEIASQIQLSTLPSSFPAFPERNDFDLYAMMIPAQEVGGDFYDFFLVDEHHLGFVLGDVSGKGVGAAMFMAITRTMLRATALQGLDAGACMTHVNRVLFPETMPRMFVTAFYGVLDTRTGEVDYCNAGHNPPYVLHGDGQVEVLARTGGLGLCLTGVFDYQSRQITLAKGDSLFLFTDGVTEAVGLDGDQFGEDRLEDKLAVRNSEGPAEVIRDVLRAVSRFTDGANQSDDITMLSMQYRGEVQRDEG